MARNPNQEPDDYRGYRPQQTPSPYNQDEMPQSSYPQMGYPPGQSPSPEEPYSYQQQQQYEYRQPQYGYLPAGDVGPTEMTGIGMKARTAGWLSYLFGWVTGLIFFLLERENRFVRFHAVQSILFFGGLSIVQWLLSYLPFFSAIGGALGVVMFIGWIILMVNAGKGRYYKLPILGDLAERLANQIR